VNLRGAASVALALAVLAAALLAACGGGGDDEPELFPGEIVSEGPTPILGLTAVTVPLEPAPDVVVSPASGDPTPNARPSPETGTTPESLPTVVPTATATPSPVHTLTQTERQALAVRFIETTNSGDYEGAVSFFDDTVREALGPQELGQLWGRLVARSGDYLAVQGFTENDIQFDKLLVVEALFQTFIVEIRIGFDVQGRITGLVFTPTRSTDGFLVPEYADADAFTESAVVVWDGGDWPLPGTLTLPVGPGPFPAVVLVGDSGPVDRDGTVGLAKPFRDLAWGLASQGIAVLRYESRTRQYSGTERSAAFTLAAETVDDVLAALKLLERIGRLDPERVFVLGHGLGGYAIPRIATLTQEVAGYVILAGSARPIPELLIEQLEYISGLDGVFTGDEREAVDAARAAADAVEALKLGAGGGELLLGAGPAYWLDLAGYDPAQAAMAIDAPMLILQGGSDYRVTVADYQLWRDALADRPDVELTLYPGLNHFFVAIDGISTPDDLLTPANVSGQVIDDIAAWVAAN
jgi:dienelactone hydrolase